MTAIKYCFSHLTSVVVIYVKGLNYQNVLSNLHCILQGEYFHFNMKMYSYSIFIFRVSNNIFFSRNILCLILNLICLSVLSGYSLHIISSLKNDFWKFLSRLLVSMIISEKKILFIKIYSWYVLMDVFMYAFVNEGYFETFCMWT